MPRPALVFACAHLCDERLYAAQVDGARGQLRLPCRRLREHDSIGAMAEALLAAAPDRFTLIGLSLGGYVAFEVMRRAPQRVERLALLDTTAGGRHRRQSAPAATADIATVQEGGIEALIPSCANRWLRPAHRARADLVGLMSPMARHVGADGQQNQQRAMLGRPDSLDGLAAMRVPTLVAVRRR